MLRGQRREMGLGAFPDVSLDTARELAREARTLKAAGKDPLAERAAVRASQSLETARAITFRQCVDAYYEAHATKWKSAKHRTHWKNSLEIHAMPVLGDVAVGVVDKALVIKALEPVWKSMPDTASRVRGRIEAVLDWAAVRDYRTGPNPAQWRGLLDKVFPARSRVHKVKHHDALPYPEMAGFFADLGKQEGVGVPALKFAILTAARSSETRLVEWSEVDIDRATWTVPAGRMKGGREHRVPLSRQAVAILREQLKLTGGKGFVFPGRWGKKPISTEAMPFVLECMSRTDVDVHGFRSTFRDWAEEQTSFSGSVAEAALAHAVGDKTEAAYRRGDLFAKRQQMMEAWGRYCTIPAPTGKVVPIRAKK
jgi:integrase